MKISFQFTKPTNLTKRKELKQFIEFIFKKETTKATSVSFIFCSDSELLDINQKFLKHNTLTDIITFNMSENPSDPVISEIYISSDRVKENAALFNTTYTHELHRVIFHGILHLCGYQDKKPVEKKKMTEKEDYYLNHYFNVPRGTLKKKK